MIKIIDNFFNDKKEFDKIIHHIKNNIYFKARYFNNSEEKTNENYYGDRFVLNQDEFLLKTFIKQTEKKFKIKINEISDDCGIDLRNLDHFKPHTDSNAGLLNVLIMLDGSTGITTGTVFYTDGELDIHVGFRPNRAILFPSNYYHSPHKCGLKGIRRYTSTLFIKNYEEV